jgi:hypothetical protein
LAAVLYSECDVTANVGEGVSVTIRETTKYPFTDKIEFELTVTEPVEFPLYLRVPHWCEKAQVRIDGETLTAESSAGKWLCIARRWKTGDKLLLHLPMQISLRTWAANQNSVSVDRGPLTYSLEIGEKVVEIPTALPDWPAREIHPTTAWNYALVVDPDDPNRSFEQEYREWPRNNMPFTLEGVPLRLKARGRRIEQWQLDDVGLVGPLQASPVKTDQPEERITLVPMGAARLRISAFPVVGTGPDAHEWTAPPQPKYRTTASHCWDGDTVRALSDESVPKNSNDHSIARMTWWDHRGTEEWVQYDFDEPRKISTSQVYWFDDHQRNGQCRLPVAWHLVYRKPGSEQWQPVPNPSGFNVEPDQFNKVKFSMVEVEAVRLQVKLREGFSGGILQWDVE